jgi:hypothetical protein
LESVDIFYGHLEYFTAIWNGLGPFGTFYGNFSILVVIWYIFLRFGILYQEKSGNPVTNHDFKVDEKKL